MGFHYNTSVLFVLIYTLFVYFLIPVKNKFSIQQILSLLIYGILIVITVLYNKDWKFSSYLALYMQMIIALLATKIIPVDLFKKIYINIITFLALFSLFFYVIGIVYPEVAFLFPKTDAIASVDYYNVVIYVYQALIGYGHFLLTPRNAGIFWEPGAYQAFLNIGLIFLLDLVKKDAKNRKNSGMIFITLLFTVISTSSTTGYIISLLIILSYRHEILQILNIKKMKDLVFIIVVIVVGIFFISKQIYSAFILINNKYVTGSTSFVARLSLDMIIMLADVKTLFFGMSFMNYFKTSSIWNSIIQTMVVFGFPFTLLLLFNYIRSSISFVKKRWLLCLILIIIFSTESLFWRPFFLYFAFSETNKVSNKNSDTVF